MDSAKIKAAVIGILVTFVALWLGMNAATAQIQTILLVAGASTLIIGALLGTRIWLILPLCIALGLSLKIPGQPSTDLLAKALFTGFCILLFLIRKLPYRLKIGELEVWVILLLLCVLQVYFRNPVGLNLFGAASVGARPYALLGINIVTCGILVGLTMPEAHLRWFIRLYVIGSLIRLILNIIGAFIPGVGIYLGTAAYNATETAASTGRASRIGFLGDVGKFAARFVSSYISPLKSLLYPLWTLLVMFSLVAAGLSGFRSNVVMVGCIYFLALLYHGGFNHLVIASLMLAFTLALLAIFNLMMPLPANIQRSLSFLPGTWEQSIKQDGQSSSEWRFEIWEEVMLTDRWIANKWVGDGLGFSKRELQMQQDIMLLNDGAGAHRKGTSGFDMQREGILASGNYHSGPIQTIRTIGYAGLTVLLLAMIRLAVHAHRLIRRYRSTQWQPLTLFIGIPMIIQPFFFVFIYGTFSSASTALLMGTGFIRLLQNSLPAPQSPATAPPPATAPTQA